MSQFKKKLTALGAFLTFVTLSSVAVHADEFVGIQGNNVLGKTDNVYVTTGKDTQNVDMRNTAGDGAVGQVDWGRLNVGSGETLRFGFSGLSQTIINRVLGGSKSEIFGKILNGCTTGNCPAYQSTGKVVIINPAGILFGAGSQVDLNSLTATTFDFKGAKNLADLDKEGTLTKAQYLDSLRTGAASVEKLVNEDGNIVKKVVPYKYNDGLVFDRNATENFNGITANHNIELNGATFNNIGTSTNTNNTVAMLSDNIVYKNSLIKVGDNLNYAFNKATGEGTESYGKVSLITADGASFGYYINGAEKTHTAYGKMNTAPADAANPTRNISIDNNAAIDEADASKMPIEKGIYAGDVSIENRAMTDSGSDINISNAVIKADKLQADENGNIYIYGTNKVKVADSTLSTKNASEKTNAQYGGEVYVNTLGDIDISNTHIRTAGAKYPETINVPNKSGLGNAGSVRLMSLSGNANLDNTIIASEGHVKIEGYTGVNLNESAMEANNVVNPEDLKDVDILSKNDITITNTKIAATNDVNIHAAAKTFNKVVLTADLKNGGDILIDSKYAEDATDTSNLSFIKAGNNLNIRSKDTTIDNATLAYNEISFFDDVEATDTFDPADNIANVTIKNNTAFDPKGTNDITLKTNGDFTYDHATSKLARNTEITIGKDIDSTYGKLSQSASATYENADNITVAADGDLSVINASDITAKAGSITFTTGKNALVDGSKLTASGSKTIQGALLGYEKKTITEVVEVKDEKGNPVAELVDGKWQNKTEIKVTEVDDLDKPIYETTVIGGAININTIGDEASVGNLKIVNGSDLTAAGDVNLDARFALDGAAGAVTIEGSSINAGNDINIKSNSDVTIAGNATLAKDSHLAAAAKVNIDTKNNGTKVAISAVNNEAGNTIQAGSQININQGGTDKVVVISDNAKLATTGADSEINIYSDKDIKLGALPADHNREYSVIDSTTSIISANDINITSESGSIRGEKSEIGNIAYNNELTFDAAVNNEFSSKTANGSDGSFKAVNVNYIAGGANKFDVDGDIQFVDSSLNAPINSIKAGNDVILKDLKIVNATDVAADTQTTIIAGGDVTTVNVTNEGTEATHKYVGDVSTTKTGTEQTVLDVNNTKLVVRTKATVGEGERPDKGSVTLNLKNTSKDAGIDIIAENEGGWDVDVHDGNELYNGKNVNGISYGPVVTISSNDTNPVAVSRIITDKLTIVNGTDIIASAVTDITDGMKAILGSDFPADGVNEITKDTEGNVISAKGYIQVRDRGGFNQDPAMLQDPTNFEYLQTWDEGTPDKDFPDDLKWHDKHSIVYDRENPDTNFILIYKRAEQCGDTPIIKPLPSDPTTTPTTPPTIDDRDDGRDYGNADTFQRTRAENHDLNRTALPRQTVYYSDMDQFTNAMGDKSGLAAAGLKADGKGGIEIVNTKQVEKEEIQLDISSESESNNSSAE